MICSTWNIFFKGENVMLVVKLGQLVLSKEALNAFSKNKMTSVQRKAIYDVYEEVDKQVISFEKIRAEKASEYGNKNDDGTVAIDDKGMVNFTKDNFTKFSNEMNALAETDITLPGDVIDFASYAEIPLSLEEQKQLSWLFKF